MRAAFAPPRALEPTDAEIARILGRAGRRLAPRSNVRLLAAAVAAPGRALGASEDAAAYLRNPRYSIDPRVMAEAGGYRLYVAREPSGTIEFDLGNTGVGFGGIDISEFSGHALYVLGPGSMEHADAAGHVPLFGITARSVNSIELTYASGPPLRVRGIDGGFVLLADPARDPQSVIAYAANGEELERSSLHNSGHGIDIHREDYLR
jgi:hypothetical protein